MKYDLKLEHLYQYPRILCHAVAAYLHEYVNDRHSQLPPYAQSRRDDVHAFMSASSRATNYDPIYILSRPFQNPPDPEDGNIADRRGFWTTATLETKDAQGQPLKLRTPVFATERDALKMEFTEDGTPYFDPPEGHSIYAPLKSVFDEKAGPEPIRYAMYDYLSRSDSFMSCMQFRLKIFPLEPDNPDSLMAFRFNNDQYQGDDEDLKIEKVSIYLYPSENVQSEAPPNGHLLLNWGTLPTIMHAPLPNFQKVWRCVSRQTAMKHVKTLKTVFIRYVNLLRKLFKTSGRMNCNLNIVRLKMP